MVKGVRYVLILCTTALAHRDYDSALDMEVCTTLGMLSPEQAKQLKEAGLTAYNHNLDTSREYYPKVSLYLLSRLCVRINVTTGHYD